tara:strand:+ start:1318 stop:1590 length:273 start_codon:yes stop_codon:yes gene_type:complete
MMDEHVSQWYWSHDWLNRKSKSYYFGPRIDWMFLYKDKKKQIEKERKKDHEARPRIRKIIRTTKTKPAASSDGTHSGNDSLPNNRKVVST